MKQGWDEMMKIWGVRLLKKARQIPRFDEYEDFWKAVPLKWMPFFVANLQVL